MKVLFDGFWWRSGPTANRTVQRDLIEAWAVVFPADQLVIALRAGDAEHVRDLPVGADVARTRLWPHAASNALELGRLARFHDADVVVAHNYTSLRHPCATFVHDVMFTDHPEWFSMAERTYFAPMLPLARRALLRATSTRTEAARMLRIDHRGGMPEAIGLGVPTGLARSTPRVPDDLTEAVPHSYCLTVGRLNARKNLAAVIGGAAASSRVTPSTPLLVVGSSEHSGRGAGLPETVRALVEEGRVRFLGRVEDDELAWLYANSSLTISLSRDEGFGLPPLEALAAGSPLLVSDIPVYRETVGGYAAFVDPDATVERIGRAVDERWSHPVDHEVRSQILSRFAWDSAVAQLRRAIVHRLPAGALA